MKYTAEQFETMAKHLRESTPNWQRENFGDWKNCVLICDRAPKDAADMLDAAAIHLRRYEDSRRATIHTVASVRAELVEKIGDCCRGGDPACAAGCLFEEAAKRNAFK